MRVAGMDTSTKRIGYATPDGDLLSIVAKAGADDPVRRLHELEAGIIAAMRRYPPLPDVMVIEDYSLGMMTKSRSTSTGTHKTPMGVLSKIRLGEVGAVARLACFNMGVGIVVVNNSTLKRFATGKGNADKEAMVAAAIRHGARGSVNNDEADAFHARRMGRCAHQLEPMTERYEIDAVSQITW
jgi:Holliday junction resolvasome RuvABC endonuclease subunit